MTQLFIGSDMSKHFFDATYLDEKGNYIYLGQFENDSAGFKGFTKQLRSKTKIPTSQWFVCFENTGAYSKEFFKYLCDKGISRREEVASQISNSLGIKRGKTDKIDSKDICKYAFQRRDSIKPNKLDTKQISQLKKLLSYRDQLVKTKTSLSVCLKDINPTLEADFIIDLRNSNDSVIIKIRAQIKNVETQIANLIGSDDKLNESNKLVTSVVGIGKITSAYIIAYSDNFNSFTDSRKFACYSGVAPFENSSGLFKGQNKVSHVANKKIKSLLSQCSVSAIRFDPQIGAYFSKKTMENKKYGVIMNAVKNKLLHRIFAVVKRKSPYVKLQAYV